MTVGERNKGQGQLMSHTVDWSTFYRGVSDSFKKKIAFKLILGIPNNDLFYLNGPLKSYWRCFSKIINSTGPKQLLTSCLNSLPLFMSFCPPDIE